MRVIYLDSALSSNIGHYGTSCREISSELARRNIPYVIYAHQAVIPELQAELHAVPHFRWHTHHENTGDPIAGNLLAFHHGSTQMFEDLTRLTAEVGPEDLVYCNSIRPAQLKALAHWAGGFGPGRSPVIAAELGSASGLVRRDTQSWETDSSLGLTPTFYRLAAEWLRPLNASRFVLTTFDRRAAESYSALLNYQVKQTSAPRKATTSKRNRSGTRTPVVSVLGEQRPAKGYDLIPNIIRATLGAKPNTRFLIHNALPEVMLRPQNELRAMALADPRIELDERVAGPMLWNELLEKSDLVLCPYHPPTYRSSYSAVALEALSNAIPVVVPADTSLSDIFWDLGIAGEVFHKFEAGDIAQALTITLESFDHFAAMANRAAAQWQSEQGPRRLVNDLLDWRSQIKVKVKMVETGAVIDQAYMRDTDGAQKLRRMSFAPSKI